jgi:hypothetical protein
MSVLLPQQQKTCGLAALLPGWKLADKCPGDLGNFACVVVDHEMAAQIVVNFHPYGDRFARDVIGFADAGVGLQKTEPVLKLNVERIFPPQVSCIPDARKGGSAERLLKL